MTHPADGRLGAAWEALADPSLRLVSTDVFDTLVWRRVAEPVDAFPLIGRRLAAAGMLGERFDASVFGKLREMAEHRVRARRLASHRQSEIRLHEIYDAFPDWVIPAGRREAALEIELEVERELLLPDLDVLALLAAARDSGRAVAAVSDTYFSAAQLRTLLDPLVAGLAFSPLLASSDHRTNKSGGLFEVLLSEAGVPAESVLHLGDNALGDVAFPGRAGIRTLYFPRRPEDTEAALRGERRLAARSAPAGHGDFGITALRGKAAARRASGAETADATTMRHFGATVAGPVLSGFADWVVTRARAAGAARIACAGEPGSLLLELLAGAAAAGSLPAPCVRELPPLSVELSGDAGAQRLRLLPPPAADAGGAEPAVPFLRAGGLTSAPGDLLRAEGLMESVWAAAPGPLRDGAVAFQRERLRYEARFPQLQGEMAAAADVLLPLLLRAAADPTAAEARAFSGAGWTAAPSVDPHADAADMALRVPGGLPAWCAAASVRPESAQILTALADGWVDAEALGAASGTGGFAISGRPPAGPPVVAGVRRNWLGLSRVRASLRGPGIAEVLLEPATRPCAVRFDRISVRGDSGDPAPAGGRAVPERARWLAPGVLACAGEGSGLVVPVDPGWERVEVACDVELLELPAAAARGGGGTGLARRPRLRAARQRLRL